MVFFVSTPDGLQDTPVPTADKRQSVLPTPGPDAVLLTSIKVELSSIGLLNVAAPSTLTVLSKSAAPLTLRVF